MLFIATAVWIVATVLAIVNGRRGLAFFSVILGGAMVYGLFAGKVGYPVLAGLALLDVTLLIVNKYDMR